MKKFLLVFASYNDARQDFFRQFMSVRNREYCDLHGYEYIEITSGLVPFRGHLTWLKFTKVRDLINDGVVKDGDVVVHLDADMALVKPEIEFPCHRSFNYAIDSGNSHCMGCYSLKVNEWSRNMIDLILDDYRYSISYNNMTIHEAFGTMSSFWHEFREQASWYDLAGIKRHSWAPFLNMPHYGWHSSTDTSATYSLAELYQNVSLLGAHWNVTEMPGESGCEFLINVVQPDDVIIRHFAGGQPWRKEWFDRHITG